MARNQRIETFDEPRIRKLDPIAIISALNLLRRVLDEQIGRFDQLNRKHLQGMTVSKESGDPSDPGTGEAVMWISDGTGTGEDGELLMKVNISGTSQTFAVVTVDS